MTHLIFILIALALVIAWVALLDYESRNGVRFVAAHRANLDATVERIQFIFEHVDLISFMRDEARHRANRIGHDSVELTLRAVRTMERFLTHLVRSLRTRHMTEESPRETAREFVKQLSEFKEQLQSTHPTVPDIH